MRRRGASAEGAAPGATRRRGVRVRWASALLAAAALLVPGCRAVGTRFVTPFLFDEAPAAGTRLYADLPYRIGAHADPRKHRLDLFLPAAVEAAAEDGAPRADALLVFVHGGGWSSGDKALEAGGADVYRNLGRYFAARGVAVALLNYRLQPEVGWRAQVADVADAVAWLHANAPRYGAPAGRLFLAGHSAGAQLAAHVALDAAPLRRRGLQRDVLCGVVAVSGSAYDLTDAATWAEGLPRDYFEARFRRGPEDEDWAREASPLRKAEPRPPPFLVMYGAGEPPGLKRQSHLLHGALQALGGESRLVRLEGEGHLRILFALSRRGDPGAQAIARFLETTRCPRPSVPADGDGGPGARYPAAARRPPGGGPR